jgi:hypothetical protein
VLILAFTTIFLCVEQMEESIAKRKEKLMEILESFAKI